MNELETQEIERLGSIFLKQKAAGNLSFDERIDVLSRLESLCRDNILEITRALEEDFGFRDPDVSFMADIYPQLSSIKHALKHLSKWVKKERVSSGFMFFTGQRKYILYESLGVVGIISAFNAPVSLSLEPAVDAIAAGNRVMIKMPEITPCVSGLLRDLVSSYFSDAEVSVICGDQEVSKSFASLPWDKLCFTGSSETGKKILASASVHLTPVLLELGGKSPCIVLDDANIEQAAYKICKARLLNGGQVCIAGDYVLLPERHLEKFIDFSVECVAALYDTDTDNECFTSIITDVAFDRVVGYINEAQSFGCRIVECNPIDASLPDSKSRKVPLTIIVNPAESLSVSKHEAFAPILSIYTYKDLYSIISHVNRNAKPLALYIFGNDRSSIDTIINNTSSGGVTVNDVLLHASMGIGGVGDSGMGRRGGFIGFKTFSNPKAVFEAGFLRKFSHNFIPPIKSVRFRRMLRKSVNVE